MVWPSTIFIQGGLYNSFWFKNVSICGSTISKTISQCDKHDERAGVWSRSEGSLPTSMFSTWILSYGNKYQIFPRNMSLLLVISIARIHVGFTSKQSNSR